MEYKWTLRNLGLVVCINVNNLVVIWSCHLQDVTGGRNHVHGTRGLSALLFIIMNLQYLNMMCNLKTQCLFLSCILVHTIVFWEFLFHSFRYSPIHSLTGGIPRCIGSLLHVAFFHSFWLPLTFRCDCNTVHVSILLLVSSVLFPALIVAGSAVNSLALVHMAHIQVHVYVFPVHWSATIIPFHLGFVLLLKESLLFFNHFSF